MRPVVDVDLGQRQLSRVSLDYLREDRRDSVARLGAGDSEMHHCEARLPGKCLLGDRGRCRRHVIKGADHGFHSETGSWRRMVFSVPFGVLRAPSGFGRPEELSASQVETKRRQGVRPPNGGGAPVTDQLVPSVALIILMMVVFDWVETRRCRAARARRQRCEQPSPGRVMSFPEQRPARHQSPHGRAKRQIA
jgi:hypothetical protein